jgi:hypothetical protein
MDGTPNIDLDTPNPMCLAWLDRFDSKNVLPATAAVPAAPSACFELDL